MVGPFLVQPVLHNWYNKDCGMVHIKDPLLLIEKSNPCSGSSRFPLTEWSICQMPYSRKENVSFLPSL